VYRKYAVNLIIALFWNLFLMILSICFSRLCRSGIFAFFSEYYWQWPSCGNAGGPPELCNPKSFVYLALKKRAPGSFFTFVLPLINSPPTFGSLTCHLLCVRLFVKLNNLFYFFCTRHFDVCRPTLGYSCKDILLLRKGQQQGKLLSPCHFPCIFLVFFFFFSLSSGNGSEVR